MDSSRGPARVRLAIAVGATVVMVAGAAISPAMGSDAADAVTPYGCTAGEGDCIPTPEQCATGNFNGYWPKPDGTLPAVGKPDLHRTAQCVGGSPTGEPHVAHYVGGDLDRPCGAIIEADVILAGFWDDPNYCEMDDNHGVPGHGRRFAPAVAGSGVVVSEAPAASQVGADILASGGNAMDAAVATVFAAGVLHPGMGGLGGNGHLVYRSASGEVAALDFEAVAPAAAKPKMFDPSQVNATGGPGAMPGWTGHRVVGVPGVPAGMSAALDRFGTISLADAVAPAVEIARDRAVVTPGAADDYDGGPIVDTTVDDPAAAAGGPEPVWVSDAAGPTGATPPQDKQVARLSLFPGSRIYLHDGRAPIPGERLDLSQLADDLVTLGRYGPAAFYDVDDPHGTIARALVADMDNSRAHPVLPGDEGLMTAKDLKDYRAIWRTPISTTYHGTQVYAPPPPDAGPVQLLESLNILETRNLSHVDFGSADYWHLLAETQKLTTADVGAYVNDPAFATVPTKTLISKAYAAKRSALIDMDHAATDVRPGSIPATPPATVTRASSVGHTDSVSVIDKTGNAVAITFSINDNFGSAVVAPGTGFLLNSNLDPAPAGSPQDIRAGKRTLSPITPTLVVRGGRTILALGGVGGSTIPEGVLQVLTDVVDYGQDLATAIDAPRLQEWTCCELDIEGWRVPGDTLRQLTDRGHSVVDWGEYYLIPMIEAAASPAPGSVTGVGDVRMHDQHTAVATP